MCWTVISHCSIRTSGYRLIIQHSIAVRHCSIPPPLTTYLIYLYTQQHNSTKVMYKSLRTTWPYKRKGTRLSWSGRILSKSMDYVERTELSNRLSIGSLLYEISTFYWSDRYLRTTAWPTTWSRSQTY